MALCPYENNPCEVVNCIFIKKGNPKPCGLFSFLSAIDIELNKFSKEKSLIQDLREIYVEAWNKNIDSRAKGKATGTALEKWLKNRIEQKIESGKVNFNFGEFAVDVAIPTTSNPKIILEVKVYTDIQHTLALGALLNFSQPDWKIGLVTFYNPESNTKSPVHKILDKIKTNNCDRFDYFFIQGGWSSTIKNLNEFCNIS